MTAATLAANPVVPEAVLDVVFQVIAGTYRSPGTTLANDLGSGAFAAALQAVAAECELAAPVLSEPDVRELQAAYVDLFVSSRRGVAAAPYVGVALDGELMGDSAQQLGAAFAAAGIELTPTWRDLPDHIAAVAEGGSLLVRSGRSSDANDLLSEFIAPWFAYATAAIIERDHTGFYAPVTQFLHDAIKEVTREVRP